MKVSTVLAGDEFWIGDARIVICKTGRHQARVGVEAPQDIRITNPVPSSSRGSRGNPKSRHHWPPRAA